LFCALSRGLVYISNANPACSCVYIYKFQFRPIHPPSRRLSGGGNILGINDTFGKVRPSLGRRRDPRSSTLKDDVVATPGQSLSGSSPGIRLEQAARPVTPGPRPTVLQGRQPDPRPWLVNSGVGPANGRPGWASANLVSFSSQLCPCSC
jgi:hypothetical protein